MNPLRIFLLAALMLVILTGEVDAKEPEWSFHPNGNGQMRSVSISADGEYIVASTEEMDYNEVMNNFEKHVNIAKELMLAKNHDYGEAWRDMRVSSLTDLILQKLLRVKQIEDNEGSTLISEGIDANYLDMLNYAVFALIKLKD